MQRVQFSAMSAYCGAIHYQLLSLHLRATFTYPILVNLNEVTIKMKTFIDTLNVLKSLMIYMVVK